jgi:ABC-type nitrate/sulfonate/bicarbonate transport system permease component
MIAPGLDWKLDHELNRAAECCDLVTQSDSVGLGSAILLAARAFRAADLYAGLVLLGLVGLLSSYGLIWVERRLTRWRQAALR